MYLKVSHKMGVAQLQEKKAVVKQNTLGIVYMILCVPGQQLIHLS